MIRDILSGILLVIFMLGLMFLSLNVGRGLASPGSGFNFGQWFGKMTHIQQAEQDAQAIGDKRRDDDRKLQDAHQALEDKMRQQHDKMEAAQDRIRAMNERNDAQRRRLEAQMERINRR